MIQEPDANLLVSINILDKEYRITCREGEQKRLIASALYLDQCMREVRQSARIIGADRIAIMAALNIANELLEQRQIQESREQDLNERVRLLNVKIAQVLPN